jgi:drug/metabolite transporter (DMT)-like permease
VLWISAAIATAAIMGVVAIIDSHLLARRMPGLGTFILPVGIIHLVIGLIILAVKPLPEGVEATPLVVAFASGIVRSGGTLLMLNTMRSQEVSRIIPVVHTFPIFVAVLAVPFLGETLGYLEWLSIFITVAGAVLISVQAEGEAGRFRLNRSFIALLGSSLLIGIANTTGKYALDYISYWNLYSVNAITFSVVFLLISARKTTLKEIRDLDQRGLALGLLFLNEVIALAGIILSYWAMQQGPVSLVSTILSIRPAFVFIFALVLSQIFPNVLEEHLTRRILIIKIISIALIIGGVSLLTLHA